MAAPQPKFILFSSSSSNSSRQAESFLRDKIPNTKIIRLDTKEQRDRAKNGRYFSIQGVPTLVLQFPNGQFQVLAGIQEINKIFQPPPGSGREDGRDVRPTREGRSRSGRSRGDNMYDNPDGWRKKSPYPESDDESFDEPPSRGRPRVHEESSEDSEESPQPPPSRGKAKKKVRISEPRKKSVAPKSDLRKKGREDADRKLAAAKKASSGEGMTASQKRGRAEATKKLSALTRKSKPASRMKSVMAQAKEQEGYLKQALD